MSSTPQVIKRGMDLALSLIGLFFLAPFMTLISFMIKCE